MTDEEFAACLEVLVPVLDSLRYPSLSEAEVDDARQLTLMALTKMRSKLRSTCPEVIGLAKRRFFWICHRLLRNKPVLAQLDPAGVAEVQREPLHDTDAVERCREQLPRKHAEAITLTFYYGLTIRAAAQVMGIGRTALHLLRIQALQLLHKCLGGNAP